MTVWVAVEKNVDIEVYSQDPGRYGDRVSLRELLLAAARELDRVERLRHSGATARAMITFKLDVADRAVVQDYLHRVPRQRRRARRPRRVLLLDPDTAGPALSSSSTASVRPPDPGCVRQWAGDELVLDPDGACPLRDRGSMRDRDGAGRTGTVRRPPADLFPVT